MFEEKESFWRKKGFYLSACTLLVAIMAVGAIYYSRSGKKESNSKLMADIATEVPDVSAKVTATPDAGREAEQANAGVSKDTSAKENMLASANHGTTKSNETRKDTKANKNTKSNTKKETKSTPASSKAQQDKQSKAITASANQIKHSFDEEAGLLWPVQGDVILKYSITNTVYFKTLAQYKCNPGIAIAAKEGTNVKAAADCRVTKIEKDDELGTVVTTDIGDNFTVTYGQLDNLSVNKGDELKEGDVIGTVAKPTKYYSVEGSNLFLQVNQGKETVDPLLLLR